MTDTTRSPLKPCPFCGCKAKFTHQKAPSSMGKKRRVKLGSMVYWWSDTQQGMIGCDNLRCKVRPQTGMVTHPDCSAEEARNGKKLLPILAKVWNKRASTGATP